MPSRNSRLSFELAKRILTCVGVMVALGCVSPATAAESTVGVAYDSVTKQVFSNDPPLRPQDFDADFRAGLLPSSNCAPSLVRRYMTTQRERIEDVCKQDATIVDCNARTATMLAVGAKTYLVVSLDAPDSDVDAAFAWATGTGVRMTSSSTIERTALGPRKIGGFLTDEYKTLNKQTITSSALTVTLTVTTVDSWIYYFLPTPLPELACVDTAARWLSRYGTPQRYEPELRPYSDAWMEKVRKKFGYQITESGPTLPPWRAALYSIGKHFQHQTDGAAGAGFDFTTFLEVESGNFRPIQSDDPAFTVPPDFTKMPQQFK